MTITSSQNRILFNELVALLKGQLVLHEDAAYEQVRQLWNGRVKTRPAAIARCLSIQDVIHTVRWTRADGLGVKPRYGYYWRIQKTGFQAIAKCWLAIFSK